jgi:hypothetical protein
MHYHIYAPIHILTTENCTLRDKEHIGEHGHLFSFFYYMHMVMISKGTAVLATTQSLGVHSRLHWLPL